MITGWPQNAKIENNFTVIKVFNTINYNFQKLTLTLSFRWFQIHQRQCLEYKGGNMVDRLKVLPYRILAPNNPKTLWMFVIYSTHLNLLLGDTISTFSTAIQRFYTVFSESLQRWNTLMNQSNDLKITLRHVWWDCCLNLLKQLDWI